MRPRPSPSAPWEPLNNSARSAFLPQKPQIVWCDPSDSSRSYGRGAQRARCGFCGETLRDGPLRGLRLVWAHLFGMTKPRSPKPSRSLPQRRRRARAELFRGSLGFVLLDWLALIGLLITSTVLGNLAGIKLLARFDNRKFRLLFSLVLTVLALRLLWQAMQAVYGST